MWKRLHLKYPLFLSDFNKTWILSTDFQKKKKINTNFHQNPSIGSRVVPWGQRDRQTDRQTGRQTKLIVAFRNFENAPKDQTIDGIYSCLRCITWYSFYKIQLKHCDNETYSAWHKRHVKYHNIRYTSYLICRVFGLHIQAYRGMCPDLGPLAAVLLWLMACKITLIPSWLIVFYHITVC
jgi:hypothetical protein